MRLPSWGPLVLLLPPLRPGARGVRYSVTHRSRHPARDVAAASTALANCPRTARPRRPAAWFKPVSRIKLFVEGDPIKYNSPIFLESASSRQDANMIKIRWSLPENGTLEATNARSTVVRFRLFATHAEIEQSSAQFLSGGAFIRIFHQEQEAMLTIARHDEDGDIAAESATKHRGVDFVCEQDTLCLEELPSDTAPEDSHSASSLWQIELKDNGRGGRAVQWGEPLRLKNVISDCYLDVEALTKIGSLGLAPTLSPTCLVTLEPPALAEIEPGQAIKYTDPIYIKGTGGAWLHAGEDHLDDYDGAADTAATVLIKPEFLDRFVDEDAFNLLLVDLQDIQELSRAKEAKQILDQFLAAGSPREMMEVADGSPAFKFAAGALDRMIRFCTADDTDIVDAEKYDGEPIAFHQNILIDLRFEDTLIAIVSAPFKPKTHNAEWSDELQLDWLTTMPKLKGFSKIVRKCYLVLKQMCKANPHNGFVVAQKYKLDMTNACRLISKVEAVNNWDIATTLQEIFRDNGMLLKDINPSFFSVFIDLIREADTGKRPSSSHARSLSIADTPVRACRHTTLTAWRWHTHLSQITTCSNTSSC